MLRSQTTREKIPLGIVYSCLRRIGRYLEAERDENERENGVREPCEGQDVRELQIWSETGT